MNVVYPRCAGLDIHKKLVVACRITLDAAGSPIWQTRRFSTMTADLLALCDWLAEGQVTHVAMESTGVYWKPVYNLLEGHFELLVVNARHMKNVPGRKTDLKDAEWIAQLLQMGLLKASFIPPPGQRELRELTRERTNFIREEPRSSIACRRCSKEPTSSWRVWQATFWGSLGVPCSTPWWMGRPTPRCSASWPGAVSKISARRWSRR